MGQRFRSRKKCSKEFLPQSSSDFIFAIIIEEYGLIGGLFLLTVYALFLLRIIIISNKAESIFGSLLVIALGVPIVFQALVNIGVSVELFPITGQPLQLISSFVTSIWMNCISIGIIQSFRNVSGIQINNIEEDSPLDILKETI